MLPRLLVAMLSEEVKRALRSRRARLIAAATVVAAALLVAAVRTLNGEHDLPANPYETSSRVVVAVVADTSPNGDPADAEMLRGIRIWYEEIERRGGIDLPAANAAPAAVHLEVEGDRGTVSGAKDAARRAMAAGANIVLGPPHPRLLAAVAEEVGRRKGLLFAPIQRPVGLPEARFQTFLSFPAAGAITPSLDAIDRVVGRRPRGRVVVLYIPGRWGSEAGRAIAQIRPRAYRPVPALVRGDDAGPALARSRAEDAQAVIAFAPLPQSLRWFRAAPASGTPWILAAEDVQPAQSAVGGDTVALNVPWSPTTPAGGTFFGADEFSERYRLRYGRLPGAYAAAGAALGITLTESIVVARSTDPSRILGGRDRLQAPSFWGQLRFRDGQQQGAAPALVLLENGRIRPIWPEPFAPRRLRLSVPPGP